MSKIPSLASAPVMPGTANPLDNLRAAIRERSLKNENKELRRELRHWQKVAEDFDNRLTAALSLRKHLRDRPLRIEAKRGKESESVAVVAASCWHVEETVKGKTVNGLNEYNLDIADARIARLFQNALRMVEIQRHGTDVDTLVFALLGDLMTGYIHEELLEGNSLSPTETILWLQKRIVAGLRMLRDKGGFKRILVPCCIGNHGRTTLKKRIATAHKNSFEWLMYHILADAFTEVVEFRIVESYFNTVQVFGRNIRFSHGDYIKYGGGIGGITIPVNKAISQWNKSQHADLDVFGHWHQTKADSHWVSTASLIGYNAFSVAIKADYEPPQQTFFLFEKRRGRTVTAPITLAE